jgi:hypothetical protein
LHGEIELNVAIRPDELQAKLIEHGLPTSIYGMDRPLLDAEVKAIEAKPNGDCSQSVLESNQSKE